MGIGVAIILSALSFNDNNLHNYIVHLRFKLRSQSWRLKCVARRKKVSMFRAKCAIQGRI